jgi:hypothetical protein
VGERTGCDFLKAAEEGMAEEGTFSLSLWAGLGVAFEKLLASALVFLATAGEEVPWIWSSISSDSSTLICSVLR